ncbi:MAG: thioredoxin family protein [Bacilli bacterium]
MKKIFKTVCLVLTLIIVSGCAKKVDNEFKFKKISLNDFKQMIVDKKSFAIYVGNDSCSACVAYKPTLTKVANEHKLTIYYLDNSKLSSDEFKDFSNYLNVTGTPTIAFIENGEEETSLNRITGVTDEKSTIEKFKTNGYIK